ncbi:uncharacterized protein DSM5745_03660 [Aspergillus mulundensis]|uniref:Uncharacterized protein n=1 Tax=Aspergillus mulundensis TaxID=1810919 RepID=A0A3D8SMJ3_9EURO|nr:hypothetical protein DSM5745_03660 [Aspergillus mulundensis]RDW87018.1 hypothetical protein DSM5745_03660 [Aspergillus mulundensis]
MSPNTTSECWEVLTDILGGITPLWALRVIADRRVSANETGVKTKVFNKQEALTGFIDPKAILLFISAFAAAIPNAVVNSFSTIIVLVMGFSTTKTRELKSVGDALQIIALLISGTITLNVPNSRLPTATAANILCTTAAACIAYLRHVR